VAALAVLRRDGPSGLTLRAVAAEGGFSNPAIYRHYENKEALIRSVIHEVYGVFKSYVFEAADIEGNRERLVAAIDAVCRFALDYPHYYSLLFLDPHRLVLDRYPADFQKGKSIGFRYLTDLVMSCLPRSTTRERATDVAITILAQMHGLVILHQTGRFNDDPALFEKFYRESMRDVIGGLLGDSASESDAPAPGAALRSARPLRRKR
jgi:AcrR family transcriptional regulator